MWDYTTAVLKGGFMGRHKDEQKRQEDGDVLIFKRPK